MTLGAPLRPFAESNASPFAQQQQRTTLSVGHPYLCQLRPLCFSYFARTMTDSLSLRSLVNMGFGSWMILFSAERNIVDIGLRVAIMT